VFVVVNHQVVRRQTRRGYLFLLLSLAVFVAGFVATWSWPHNEVASTFALAALFLGVLLWQVHQYYLRRWDARHRLDRDLSQALRGLGSRYTLVCFADPRLPDYLLLGPHGVAILVARNTDGTIRCRNDRWSRRETPRWAALLGADVVRNPTLEARQNWQRLGEYLRQVPGELGEVAEVPVMALIVFTHPHVQLEVEQCAFPVLRAREVPGYLQQQRGAVPAPVVQRLRDWLVPPAILAEAQVAGAERARVRPSARRR
jgi:hypothetical protein